MEGQEDVSFYTLSVSPDVQFPVDVVVSLPFGTTQGSVAEYNSGTQSVIGAFGSEFRVSLDASNPGE